MLNEGFSCENAYINYLPSTTAVGHTCIFTGSVPSITGISGNDWTDQLTGAHVYCTDDSTVQSVGASTAPDGKMSPRNLLVSTITDELRMATKFQSRVVGISLKDRAAILPAGHTGNAAFWLDDESGNFISSTYYMEKLPEAVKKFNSEKNIDKYLRLTGTHYIRLKSMFKVILTTNHMKESCRRKSLFSRMISNRPILKPWVIPFHTVREFIDA